MTSRIPVSSPGLYAAYVAWRDCKEGDAYWFDKKAYGLCDWARRSCRGLTSELASQFLHHRDAGLIGAYPFGTYPFGGLRRYRDDRETASMHLNMERIKWVNDRIADYEQFHAKARSDEPS